MTDGSEPWSQRRQGLLARAKAAADAPASASPRLPVTSASPGFVGLLGQFLEERQAGRRERGRVFLAAAKTPRDARVWQRVEQVLEGRFVADRIVVRLSPVLLVATPAQLPQPYWIGASEVLLGMDLDLEADELVMQSAAPRERSADAPPSIVHIGPADLGFGFEQGRYCQLRCEGTPPDVAADIVRMVLRR